MMIDTKTHTISFNMQITLPEDLAHEAETRGLLTSQAIEALLRSELRRKRVDRLFDAADRLAALPFEPLTEIEVEAEIQAVRQQRR